MNDGPYRANELISKTNAIIEKVNNNFHDEAYQMISHVVNDYADILPMPESAHPIIHTLALCAKSINAMENFSNFLTYAAYNVERDKSMRSDLNQVNASLSKATDILQICLVFEKYVHKHIRENVIYPKAHDIFKLSRSIAITLDLPQLLVPIDKAKYYSSCLDPIGAESSTTVGIIEVTGHGINGFNLYSNGDCPISAAIEKTGTYEPTSMQVWAGLAASSCMIIDIGAHVGFYSLLAASTNSSIPIHALEPNPDAYKRLQINKDNNNFDNIECHPIAGAGTSGETEFQYIKSELSNSISEVGSTTGREWNRGTKIVVETRCIDDLGPFPSSGRPLIKIDTEGLEGEVVCGGEELIKSLLPDFMIESFDSKMCELINEALEGYGYRYFRIIEGSHELIEMERMLPAFLSDTKDFNALITNRPVDELERIIPIPHKFTML